ncbi:MAG: RNA polymerase sigma factor [Flavobacteriaceae bacterium]
MKLIKLHNEKRLVRDCQSGDRRAQKLLYDTYAPKMLFVCRRYFQEVYLAEDALLKSFLKVYQNLNKFEFQGSFEGWIRKTVVRTCIDSLRQQKIDLRLDDNYAEQVVEEQTIDPVYSQEQLLAALNRLPKGYSVVFNLYAIEGYKHREIAQMLEITESTSKTQLLRARKLLKEYLTKNKSYETSIRG